jgi:uncharacterized protein (DUF1330 family)
MVAYVIAGNNVVDAEAMREYSAQVPATLEPFGGKFVARGGQVEVAEGAWSPARLVVIEFPSLDHARDWYHSDAYQAIIQMRFAAANTDFLIFADGVG